MIEIIIGAIILLIVYLFIQDDSDKETKTEPIDQQLLETQEVDKSEKERLENLEHENFTVVYTYLSKDGKPSALIKRSGNTSTPFASVERSKTAFKLSENLYLQKRKANQWDWYDESEYQKQISLIQKQEKQAAKLFYEEQEAKRLKLYNFILPKIDEIKLAELEFKSKPIAQS